MPKGKYRLGAEKGNAMKVKEINALFKQVLAEKRSQKPKPPVKPVRNRRVEERRRTRFNALKKAAERNLVLLLKTPKINAFWKSRPYMGRTLITCLGKPKEGVKRLATSGDWLGIGATFGLNLAIKAKVIWAARSNEEPRIYLVLDEAGELTPAIVRGDEVFDVVFQEIKDWSRQIERALIELTEPRTAIGHIIDRIEP